MNKGQKIRLEQKRFPYQKTLLYRKAIEYVVLMFLMLIILVFFETPAIWLSGFFALLFIFLLVFGISPLLTSHILTKRRLLIRQGWYFKLVIPIKNIKDVESQEQGKVGLKGISGKSAMYVTTSEHNLISIKLKTPKRCMYVFGKKIDEVIVNVENRDKFLEELGERIHSLQSNPTVLNPSLGT